MTDHEIESQGILKIVVENAYDMAQHQKDAFILIRRNGFGASDSSILLGVNPFVDTKTLIEQKLTVGITEEERAVGEKESVRKGADLEPLILQKFEDWASQPVYKPDAMYQFVRYPQLTVNFDGVMPLMDALIPVEAKYVSPYANKYWDRNKCISALHEGSAKLCAGSGIEEHITLEAQLYGVPPYYYTQVQQQLLGLDAPFGYLVALFDKGWEIGVYKIYKDPSVQMELIRRSDALWHTVEDKRNAR